MNYQLPKTKKYRVCAIKGCRRKADNDPIPFPHEYHGGRHITLFGWTLFVYRNRVEYQLDVCSQCFSDESSRPLREAYDAGVDYGVSRQESRGDQS